MIEKEINIAPPIDISSNKEPQITEEPLENEYKSQEILVKFSETIDTESIMGKYQIEKIAISI